MYLCPTVLKCKRPGCRVDFIKEAQGGDVVLNAVDLVAQARLDVLVRVVEIPGEVHQVLHLDQTQEQGQARPPDLTERVLSRVYPVIT